MTDGGSVRSRRTWPFLTEVGHVRSWLSLKLVRAVRRDLVGQVFRSGVLPYVRSPSAAVTSSSPPSAQASMPEVHGPDPVAHVRVITGVHDADHLCGEVAQMLGEELGCAGEQDAHN